MSRPPTPDAVEALSHPRGPRWRPSHVPRRRRPWITPCSRRLIPPALMAAVAVVPLLGCASATGPRQLRITSGAAPPEAADWSRVRALPPATPVWVTVRGSEPCAYWMVQSDAASLIVLNLAEQVVPTPAARVLLTMAKDHPDWFASRSQGGAFERERVRIGRDGLFVADRHVAEFAHIVQSITRDTIIEIRGPVVARGSVLGAVVGAWAGFSIGVVPGLGGAPGGAAWSALIGSTVGGGVLGSHWSSHRTDGLVYRRQE